METEWRQKHFSFVQFELQLAFGGDVICMIKLETIAFDSHSGEWRQQHFGSCNENYN